MRESFILTVYNRPELMLLNTLHSLAKCDMADCEVVIVNDGSDVDYSGIWKMFDGVLDLKVIEHDSSPCYSIGGYNNPARAFNAGMEAATGEYWWLMSSDIIVQPGGIDSMRRRNRDLSAVFCRVVNMDNGAEYLGPSRLFPMHWLVTTHHSHFPRFDEAFMDGMDFDDNDFAGELARNVGKFICDWDITAYHQSHPQTAYTDGLAGHKINKGHILEKWGGIPWSNGPDDPIEKEFVEIAGTWVVTCGVRGDS